jgi:hypothetical protein
MKQRRQVNKRQNAHNNLRSCCDYRQSIDDHSATNVFDEWRTV